jgi:glutathione S-transferase
MLESWFDDKGGNDGSGTERSPDVQSEVDGATRKLALYHYESCWFCRRVRGTIDRLKLNIELRDIHRDDEHRRRLVTDGRSGAVPCLHIENDDGVCEWLYESSDICAYLEGRFGVD